MWWRLPGTRNGANPPKSRWPKRRCGQTKNPARSGPGRVTDSEWCCAANGMGLAVRHRTHVSVAAVSVITVVIALIRSLRDRRQRAEEPMGFVVNARGEE